MIPTTIAQLTDIHLGPIVGLTPRYWNVKRATGYANWTKNRRYAYSRQLLAALVEDIKRQHVDHVAVTGDLVNLGLPMEIKEAARWLESVGLPEYVSVIPGNHDIYSKRGAAAAIDAWGAYMGGRAADDPIVFPYVKFAGQVALIGLNSAIPTAPLVAHGRLGKDQIDKLGALLDRLRQEGWFRLVMIHHPPLPGQAPRLRGLADAELLSQVLRQHGAELVIHGHNHVEAYCTLLTRTGSAHVVGAPSSSLGIASKHEPLARYNLYRIGQANGRWQLAIETRGFETLDGPVIELRRHGHDFNDVELSRPAGV